MKFSKSFFLLYVFFIGFLYSQVNEEQKLRWIQNLTSSNYDTAFDAAGSIEVYEIKEAVPALEANISQQVYIDIKMVIFRVLANFKSSNASVLIKNFMDSIPYYIARERKNDPPIPHKLSDTTKLKLKCAEYLLEVGDYSYVQLILDDIQSMKPRTEPLYWVQIFNEMPHYASIVKPKIMEYINDTTKPGGVFKSRLLYDLRKKQGFAFFPDMLTLTRTSPDPWIRHIVLFQLIEMNYPNVLALLEERFLQDSYSTMKREIAETLLTRYGSINEYAFLQTNINQLGYPFTIDYYKKRLQDFIPPRPPLTLGTKELLDSLISLVKIAQTYEYLGDSHFAHDLTKKLDEAKKHLTKKHADTKDSIKCAKEVRKFQKKVNEVYEETIEKEKKHEQRKEKFVTVEGWKFLYYNAQYILDRLPAIKKEDEEEEE